MRDTAVVLRKKHAVVRHEIYKYAVVHTSNRDKSFNAQANAKHQSSNNMAKGLVSDLIILQISRIPGRCEGIRKIRVNQKLKEVKIGIRATHSI